MAAGIAARVDEYGRSACAAVRWRVQSSDRWGAMTISPSTRPRIARKALSDCSLPGVHVRKQAACSRGGSPRGPCRARSRRRIRREGREARRRWRWCARGSGCVRRHAGHSRVRAPRRRRGRASLADILEPVEDARDGCDRNLCTACNITDRRFWHAFLICSKSRQMSPASRLQFAFPLGHVTGYTTRQGRLIRRLLGAPDAERKRKGRENARHAHFAPGRADGRGRRRSLAGKSRARAAAGGGPSGCAAASSTDLIARMTLEEKAGPAEPDGLGLGRRDRRRA